MRSLTQDSLYPLQMTRTPSRQHQHTNTPGTTLPKMGSSTPIPARASTPCGHLGCILRSRRRQSRQDTLNRPQQTNPSSPTHQRRTPARLATRHLRLAAVRVTARMDLRRSSPRLWQPSSPTRLQLPTLRWQSHLLPRLNASLHLLPLKSSVEELHRILRRLHVIRPRISSPSRMVFLYSS